MTAEFSPEVVGRIERMWEAHIIPPAGNHNYSIEEKLEILANFGISMAILHENNSSANLVGAKGIIGVTTENIVIKSEPVNLKR